MTVWYPDRLIVANIAGRALITDTYIIAEWRRDPWKGFAPVEGVWRQRDRGHKYEAVKVEPWNPASAERDERDANKMIRALLKSFAGVETVPLTRGPLVKLLERQYDHYDTLRLFDGLPQAVFVNAKSAEVLVHLIDGEPTEWRGSSPHEPIHAYDGKVWLGALMPAYVPRRDGRAEA